MSFVFSSSTHTRSFFLACVVSDRSILSSVTKILHSEMKKIKIVEHKTREDYFSNVSNYWSRQNFSSLLSSKTRVTSWIRTIHSSSTKTKKISHNCERYEVQNTCLIINKTHRGSFVSSRYFHFQKETKQNPLENTKGKYVKNFCTPNVIYFWLGDWWWGLWLSLRHTTWKNPYEYETPSA